MSWTPLFRGVDYEKRAELLLAFLKQKPAENDGVYSAYMNILHYIAGSLAVRSEYRYVSEEAQKWLTEHGKKADYDAFYAEHWSQEGLTTEHTIPVNVIKNYLLGLTGAELTVGHLAEVIGKTSGLALITKDEDKKLTKAGRHSNLCDIHDKKFKGDNKDDAIAAENRKILEEIIAGKTPHGIRYEKAGIAMAETNHDAKA